VSLYSDGLESNHTTGAFCLFWLASAHVVVRTGGERVEGQTISNHENEADFSEIS
jgi:hypothetical protein